MTPDEILNNLTELRKDLTHAQVKLSEAMRAIASLPSTPDPARKCPECGITTRGPLALAEHRYTSHGGQVPEHYLKAERLAGIK